MNYEDRVTKEYVEGLLPQLVWGTYVGNGDSVRTIDLGYRPRLLVVLKWGFGLTEGSNVCGGVCTSDYDTNAVTLVDNGFRVYYNNSGGLTSNTRTGTYLYLALK